MIRCMKTSFRANQETINRLFEYRVSGEVWNRCLELAKETHLKTGKWVTKSGLQKGTKGMFPIHSQSVQAVCHKYLFARDAARKARKAGHQTKYPYKQKKHFNTKWANNGFKLFENGKIELSMGDFAGKRQKPLFIWVKELPKGQIKEIELIFDRKLIISIAYEDGKESKENNFTHRAAIDVGEIHTIAAVAENGENIIITGQKVRSIHRLRNKKLADLQRKMSRCKKGSRQWRKYQRAKVYILSKSNNQLTDAIHKTTKQFVDWCIENEVKEVAFGDVDGVQRHTSPRKKKKVRRRKTNQKLSNWSFGKVYTYLTYKLEANGIKIDKHDERDTSQQCPCCAKKRKVASRIYTCSCGYSNHRDIHGAANFFAKTFYGEIRKPYFSLKHTKYLRIA
ncbi:RNA-guided endonuclease TnpB family protein [Bacillus sp. FJAT-50079]|uniref:RNA-guided endonuclease InsQ/TnpB family protein n=1 Tax=Bacillus sp. FJAT-50079 TaxID=2833577 RepID=UPI001BCA6428|nr:RNA-guided endonuclease TnpB family protein [Bacillus sp. FJAT-50079]MBS4207319.1 transposase [Bacillus sp. FJAT-50079]